MSDEHLDSFILPLFNELASDDQDSVRLLTIEILIAIAKRLDAQKNRDTLLEPLKSLARDKAWRVRYMVASKFVEVCDAIGEDIVRAELVQTFVDLLKDNEGEVRTAAAGEVPGK